MEIEQVMHWGCADGLTLGQLRLIVKKLEDWDDHSEIRVRTRLGANSRGAKVRRLTVDRGSSE